MNPSNSGLPIINYESKIDMHPESFQVKNKEHNKTSDNPSSKISIVCPSQENVAIAFTNVLLIVLLCGLCWGVTGDISLPGGKLYAVLLVFTTSCLFGVLATKMNLPDLFGMIISGIILRNISVFELEKSLDSEWSSFFRGTALAIILVRAGMGLDPNALRHHSCAVFRLAFLPCIVEMWSSGVTSHFILGLPWNYSFMLGSVLAAVSPAIVATCSLHLSSQGYGVKKGIPTLIMAASSIDDVLAISIFGVLIGVTFAEGEVVLIILKSPLEIFIGAVFGITGGLVMWYIPHSRHNRRMFVRFVLLLLYALFAYFVSMRAEFTGTGPFAALCLGFVSQLGWRKETNLDLNEKESVSRNFDLIWTIFKHLLFGLIGTEISFSNLDAKVMGVGLATILIGLCFRMITTFTVVSCNNLNKKEMIFITVAWLPKATVQAAMCGVAMDMTRKKGGTPEQFAHAQMIISLAVLSILITAPLGAILIMNLGPLLLSKESIVLQNAPPDTIIEV